MITNQDYTFSNMRKLKIDYEINRWNILIIKELTAKLLI